VTAKVALPTEEQVLAALAELCAATDGRRPSVVALARRVGLTNATFWRHFPRIARDVADRRRAAPPPTPPTASADRGTDPRIEHAQLRRDNRTLTDQLELAIANIQRLSLENHELRRELEHARNVSRIPAR
jgi:hypothetical protein